jgi:hypothetical protein
MDLSDDDLEQISEADRIWSILRSRWIRPRGPRLASSTGRSKNAGHGWSGLDEFAVPMASSGGSKLVICVP